MKAKAYYPINLDLEGRKCLVVGGGDVAERKVRTLLAFGAAVTVVSHQATKTIGRLSRSGKVRLLKRGYRKGDLKGAFVVIAATDNPQVNTLVARHAEDRGLLVNVVDVPKLCNFIVPSVVRRGPLTIGISTGGQSPMFAQMWRKKCEKCFTPAQQALLRILGDARQEMKRRAVAPVKAKAVYRKILGSSVLKLLETNRRREARQLFQEIIGRAET